MKLPNMPYVCIHTHEFPENTPHGWGTAYSQFVRKYEDIPGQLDEKDIPSNVQFWTNEVEKWKFAMEAAIATGNSVRVDKAFEQYTLCKRRLDKESAM
jgi:hypothetical protein